LFEENFCQRQKGVLSQCWSYGNILSCDSTTVCFAAPKARCKLSPTAVEKRQEGKMEKTN